MNAFDVINPKEMHEDKLPNGAEIIRHEEEAFSNYYNSGKSFDDIEEKEVDEGAGKGIHFCFDFKLHPDGVKKLTALGNQIQSNFCILQHNFVMYSFAYAITVSGEDEDSGLLCKFSILPVSYTYCYPTEMTKGGVPCCYKPNPPDFVSSKVTIKDLESLNLTKQTDGSYSCDTSVTLDSLNNITSNGLAILKVEMTVDKEYFEIGDYVDLNLKEAHVVSNSYKILDKILTGVDVPQSDWIMSASEGFPRDFHVHGPVLANSSFTLKAALSSHMSIGNMVAMISHENRLIFSTLKSEDMRVILTYIYHRRYVLPEFDAISRIGNLLTLLFRDEIPNFFKSWEVDIIKKIKNLDRGTSTKTVAECVKALISVHSAPKGALLAAYNVALIAAADAFQMAEAKGKKVKIGKVKKEIGQDWLLIDDIFGLIEDFKTCVCGVQKCVYV